MDSTCILKILEYWQRYTNITLALSDSVQNFVHVVQKFVNRIPNDCELLRLLSIGPIELIQVQSCACYIQCFHQVKYMRVYDVRCVDAITLEKYQLYQQMK